MSALAGPSGRTGARRSTAASASPDKAFLETLHLLAGRCFARDKHTVGDLVRAVGLGERQLQRRLRALLNTCPRDYLRELRLQKAAQLLGAGHSPVDVAVLAGFSSHSHFGARFKERFGVTPREYAAMRM